jgi:hypothetical protein
MCWRYRGSGSCSVSHPVPITRMHGGGRCRYRLGPVCTSGTVPSPAARCCRGWTRPARTTTGCWRAQQDAIKSQRTWDRPESLHIAAARLATRCDAADLHDAALLSDPLWRARGVHTGFVCHGEAVVGAGSQGGRVVVQAERLDTRLKAGTAVIGWPGDPMTAMPDAENRFSGEVVATAVEDGALAVTIGGLRRTGYRPAAGEKLIVIPAPPSARSPSGHGVRRWPGCTSGGSPGCRREPRPPLPPVVAC